MKIRQLKILVSIKEEGSINRAADKLYLAPTACSNAMKDLEKELGIKLFLRSYNKLIFLPSGDEAYEYAKKILGYIDDISHIMPDKLTLMNRKVNISADSYIGYRILADCIIEAEKAGLIECYQIANSQESNNFKIIAQDVYKDKLDISLVIINNYSAEDQLKILKKYELSFTPLISGRVLLVGREGHPLSQQEVEIGDLQGFPYIMDDNDINDYILQKYGKKYTLEEGRITVQSLPCSIKYITATDTLCAMPQWVYEENKQRSRLSAIDFKGLDWEYKIGYIHKKRNLTLNENYFIDLLEKFSKKYGD